MPELPEVETTRRGLLPHVVGESIAAVEVRERNLRWPVARDLPSKLRGRRIDDSTRRGKYLLFGTAGGTLLVHLGMSGSLRYLPRPLAHGAARSRRRAVRSGGTLRFNDPRRFGSMHFTTTPARHRLLKDLGPEPLGEDFTPEYLWERRHGRQVAIKQHLMNGHVVVGVGNIYANEALFRAGIHPSRAAGRIARARFEPLVPAVRDVLTEAVEEGGTTLRDFVGSDGNPGYFRGSLKVYDRWRAVPMRSAAALRSGGSVIGPRASLRTARQRCSALARPSAQSPIATPSRRGSTPPGEPLAAVGVVDRDAMQAAVQIADRDRCPSALQRLAVPATRVPSSSSIGPSCARKCGAATACCTSSPSRARRRSPARRSQ